MGLRHGCPDSSSSLRGLGDLRVSAVNKSFKYIHRGDAENAEVAQRISKPRQTLR